MSVSSKFKYIYNEEAERSLIIQILAQPQNLALCNGRIPKEAINNELYRSIYSKCLTFKDNHAELSVDELAVRLRDDWGTESATSENLKNFFLEGTEMSFKEAMYKVERSYYKRLIIDTLESIQQHLLSSYDIEKTVGEGYGKILKLTNKLESFNKDKTNPLIDLVRDLDNNSFTGSTVQTGISNLDRLTSGLPKGHITVVGGRSSMGKSAFAFNLLINFLSKGLKCIFFSLETSQRYLMYRLLSIKCSLNYEQVINRVFNQENKKKLQTFVKLVDYWFTEGLLTIYDDYLSYDKLEMLIRQSQGGVDVVFIDYLQIIALADKKATYLELNEIMARLKILAKELNVTVVILSQLSRAVESREDHWPQLSDLSYSGGIENAADLILLLYRPEYYYERMQNQSGERGRWLEEQLRSVRNKLHVIVAKNRNGPVGDTPVFFDTVTGEVADLVG